MISVKRDIKKTAFELLCADELQNALMIKCIHQNRADDLQIYGESVCFHDKGSGNYFYCSENIIEFEALYQPVKPPIFFLSSDTLLDDLKPHYPNLDIHNYDQWVFTSQEKIRTKDFDWLSFRELTPEDLAVVVATQNSAEFDAAYYAEQIARCATVCAVDNKTGQVLGYFLMHKDGENGPLYVSEKCRNMGLGTEMLKRITREALKTDQWPLGHVRKENRPAQAISLKSGYERCAKEVLWCYDIC